MTQTWIGAAGLLLVGALTPGPNNFVVMTTSARKEWQSTLRSITGILLGGLALFALVATGAGAAFAAEPRLRLLLTLGACGYLLWLGVLLGARSFRAEATPTEVASATLPTGLLGLFAFQFVNPKSWLMVIAVTSTQTNPWHTVALFIVIPLTCLVIWAALGLCLARQLARPRVEAWFNRAMAALFVASALLLLQPLYCAP